MLDLSRILVRMFHKNWSDKGFLCVLCFALTTFCLKAQVYPFQEIGLEQGLPSNRINDFIEDSRGFYWLATEGTGLVRYDGYDFKTYQQASQPSRLLVSAVQEDSNGNIWAALEEGLMKFDGKSFEEYELGKGQKIRHLTIENTEIVVSTNKNRIWKLVESQWEEIKFTSSSTIHDILLHKANIWVATTKGLFLFKENTLEQLDSNEAFSLAFSEDGVHVTQTGQLTHYNITGKRIASIPSEVQFIYSRGDKFCGLSKKSELVLNVNKKPIFLSEENGLPNQNFKACYIDKYGVLWLYGSKGLVKLESMALRLYTDFKEASSNQINAVHKTYGGVILGGHSSGLLEIKDGEEKVLDASNGFPYGLTLAIEEFENDLWLGTEAGLIRGKNETFKRVSLPSFSGDFVFTLKAVGGKLWIGLGGGLLSYSNGRFINVSKQFDLPPATVYSITKSKNDNSLWCATFTEGFFRKKENSWEVIKELNGNRLDSLRFSCFAAVSENEIWAGTLTEGVFHLTETGINHISPEEINFAEINSLDIDDNGNVWMGTNKGLIQVNEKGEIQDGPVLPNHLFIKASGQAIKIINNQLLLGTSEGLEVLDLTEYNKRREAPRVILTDVKMFLGANTNFASYGLDSIPYTLVPSQVKLPHDLNFLSFNLAGLSSFEKNKLRYRYRLIGQSDDWTYAGDRREAVFPGIKPGKYTFEAQVSRVNEAWNSNVLAYDFKISSPIWARWWFITLLAVIVGSLTFLFIYDRIKRVNQRLRLENDLMEMERKALRLQMNPHFIFNALDSISSFIFKKDPEKAVRYLNNFAKLMRLTLESSMEHLHPVETEVSILKNYLELEKLRFQGKFDYEIEMDEEIDYDVGIPPMLIQPHVENAILHGLKPLESNGRLDIRFILDDMMLQVEIEDNGVGRKRAKELQKRKDHRSMATQINKDRIRLLKLAVNDSIEIQILDKKDENSALGTKVILRLPAENI